MPDSLSGTESFARQVDAVKAEFAGLSQDVRLDDGGLGVPRLAERARRPRSKRVVAFMGANDLSRAASRPPPHRAPNRAPVHP